MSRKAELAERLAHVRADVAAACASAGRDASEVTLLVVTKFFPASDVALLYELGCREFGESRDQEARAKVAELRSLSIAEGLGESVEQVRWHMIGQIQRNKAKSIATWANVVQSVDDPRLVDAFARTGRPLDVLVQVSLDGDQQNGNPQNGNPQRSGVEPDRVLEIAGQIAATENLSLRGLMAIPPLEADPVESYANLARLHASLLAVYPAATTLSAGMSGDFAAAIAAGSSCVRVGTAILGRRPIPSP